MDTELGACIGSEQYIISIESTVELIHHNSTRIVFIVNIE